MSIVGPAIEAEVSYRRERIAEDYRRANGSRRSGGSGDARRSRRNRRLSRAAYTRAA